MKFTTVFKLLSLGMISLVGSAQTLRGTSKAQHQTSSFERRVAVTAKSVEVIYDQKQGNSCRTSTFGMGTEGVEFTRAESIGARWFESMCADKCTDMASCLGYEFRSDNGICNLWTVTPTAVADYPWATCSVKIVITRQPTSSPTSGPTSAPTESPTESPTSQPTSSPTRGPTDLPTESPTHQPTSFPTSGPTPTPTGLPTDSPTGSPTHVPTHSPTYAPTNQPTSTPTFSPTASPTFEPTVNPTAIPTDEPTRNPTASPTTEPTAPYRLNQNGWTAYMNSWTTSLTAEFYQGNGQRAAICGVSSHHSNNYEDRRFRFKYCTPENPTSATLTATTGYSTFDDHFYVDCGGDSFISSISSFYNGSKHDRAFKYECHKFEGYSAGQCGWTGWVNRFDDAFDFDCGDQQVVTGMDTYHSNFREDRRFRFKCCRLDKD